MIQPIRDAIVNRIQLSGEGGGVLSLNGETGDITLTSVGNTIDITTPAPNTINLETIGDGSPGGDIYDVQFNDGADGFDGTDNLQFNGTISSLGTPLNSAARLAVAGQPPTPDTVFDGTGLDDLAVTGIYDGSFGTSPTFGIIIDGVNEFGSTTDTVSFAVNGDILSSNIPILGVFPAAIAGLTFTFGSPLGHTLNDEWVTSLEDGLDIFRAIPPTGLNDFSDGGTYDETTDGTDPLYRFVISDINSPNAVNLFVNGSLTVSNITLGDFPYVRAGITFEFTNQSGHTLGDAWEVQIIGDAVASTIYDPVVPTSIDAYGSIFYPVNAAPGSAIVSLDYDGKFVWSQYPVLFGDGLGDGFVAFGDSNGNLTGSDTFKFSNGQILRSRLADVSDIYTNTNNSPIDGQLLRSVSIAANDGTGNLVEAAYMRFFLQGTPSAFNMPTGLTVALNPGAAAPTEVFFITPLAYCGFGASPQERIDNFGVTRTRGIRLNTANAGGGPYNLQKDDFYVGFTSISSSFGGLPDAAVAKEGALYIIHDETNSASVTDPIAVTADVPIEPDGVINTKGGALGFILRDGEWKIPIRSNPTFIQDLGTITGIDLKTIAATDIFTVPTGKKAFIIGAKVKPTTATAITIAPTLGIGRNANQDDIFGSTVLTGLTTTSSEWTFTSIGISTTANSGETVRLGVDVGATGTTMAADIIVYGFLVDT